MSSSLHAHQLRAKPADLHLLGTHRLALSTAELAFTLGIDPVEQGLLATQGARRRDVLATLDQPHRFPFEFERVALLPSLSFTSSLLASKRSAKGTFFGGKQASPLVPKTATNPSTNSHESNPNLSTNHHTATPNP